eukprot:jgi/Tetstr1/454141/TSEL_041060.t1
MQTTVLGVVLALLVWYVGVNVLIEAYVTAVTSTEPLGQTRTSVWCAMTVGSLTAGHVLARALPLPVGAAVAAGGAWLAVPAAMHLLRARHAGAPG